MGTVIVTLLGAVWVGVALNTPNAPFVTTV
jgi:hypothetical protein